MSYKVYLAGRFDRQQEFRRLRDELIDIGIDVTSRWLDNHGNASRIAAGDETYTDDELGDFAAEDFADIRDSDVVVVFTESPDVGYTSGGRHVETGYAMALDKNVVIVGPRENVFHKLTPDHGYERISVCNGWSDAFLMIVRLAITSKRIEQPLVLNGATSITFKNPMWDAHFHPSMRSERV